MQEAWAAASGVSEQSRSNDGTALFHIYVYIHVSFVRHMQRQKDIFYKVRPYLRLYVKSVSTSKKYFFFAERGICSDVRTVPI